MVTEEKKNAEAFKNLLRAAYKAEKGNDIVSNLMNVLKLQQQRSTEATTTTEATTESTTEPTTTTEATTNSKPTTTTEATAR